MPKLIVASFVPRSAGHLRPAHGCTHSDVSILGIFQSRDRLGKGFWALGRLSGRKRWDVLGQMLGFEIFRELVST